jgi:crotonobetainyl-CoA:carnitine CoA-transferase CaiB-like acyl-CoA transferase
VTLDGVIVADFSRILAGPLATQVLADLGADVIKVERPGSGDDTRGWGPTYFATANRGKRSVTLDLKDPDDLGLAQELVRRSDVVVESFRPGVMDRVGLTQDLNPTAVWCAIRAFGQHDLPGYDLLLQAVSGLMHVTGEPGGPPLKVGAALIDLVCGLHAATGIVAGLREPGTRFEVNLMDSALVSLLNQAYAYLNAGESPTRMGNRHPSIAPYETYGDLAIACGNDAMFRRLTEVLGIETLADDPRFATNDARVQNRDALSAHIEAALETGGDWAERLNRAGVPAGHVNDIPAAFDFARDLGLDPVWELDGIGTVRSPLKDLAQPSRRPPRLGEHDEEIRRWLRGPGGSSSGA